MRRTRAFRPVLTDVLEYRTVPSGFGGRLVGGPVATVPAQDAQKVLQDFRTFEQVSLTAVKTDLLRPAPNPAQFINDLSSSFTTLKDRLGSDTANLSATNPDLATQIQTAVGDLQNTLIALLPTSSNPTWARGLIRQAKLQIELTAYQVAQRVRMAIPPASSITAQTLAQALGQVNTQLQTFNMAYGNAIQQDLIAPGTPNGDAFRNAVASTLTTLTNNLTTNATGALGTLEATITSPSLSSTIANDLASLQTNLANIPLPQSTNAAAVLAFRLQSTYTIASSGGMLLRDIVGAVTTYNAGLGG